MSQGINGSMGASSIDHPESSAASHVHSPSSTPTHAAQEKDPQLKEKEQQLRDTASRALELLFTLVDRAEADVSSVQAPDQILAKKTLCAAIVDVKKTLEIFPQDETYVAPPLQAADPILLNFKKYMDSTFFEIRAKLRYLRRYIAKPTVDVQKLIVAARMISTMTKRLEHHDDDKFRGRGQSAPDTSATVAAAASASAAAAAANAAAQQQQQQPINAPSPTVSTVAAAAIAPSSGSPVGSSSGNVIERPLGRSQTLGTRPAGGTSSPSATLRPAALTRAAGESGSGSPLSGSQSGNIPLSAASASASVPPLNTAAISSKPTSSHNSTSGAALASPPSSASNNTSTSGLQQQQQQQQPLSPTSALGSVIFAIQSGNTTVLPSSSSSMAATVTDSSSLTPPASPHARSSEKDGSSSSSSPLSSTGTSSTGGVTVLPSSLPAILPPPAVSALQSSRVRNVSPMPTYTGPSSSPSTSGSSSSPVPQPPLNLSAFLSPRQHHAAAAETDSATTEETTPTGTPPSAGSPRGGTLLRPKKSLPSVPPLARQDSGSKLTARTGPLSPRLALPLSPLAINAASASSPVVVVSDNTSAVLLSPRLGDEITPRSSFLSSSQSRIGPSRSGEPSDTSTPTATNSAPKKSNVFTTDPEELWLGLEHADENNVNVMIERTPEGQTLVQGGTLNKLIEKLTQPETPDSTFMKLFLLTHPTILSSDLLLTKLFHRYQIPTTAKPPASSSSLNVEEWRKAVQTKVCAVLKTWLDTSFEYFTDEMLARLRQFNAEYFKVAGFSLLSSKIDGLPPALKPPVLPNNEDLQGLRIVGLGAVEDFLDFDDREIANQLTLLDFEVFSSIPMKELLSHGWSKTELSWKCPTITMIINRFNVTSNWVAHMVLGCETLKHRARMYDKFVALAKQLRRVNNYAALMSVVAGLNNAALRRLTKTLHEVPRKSLADFEQLETLMKSVSNYKAYRETIATAIPPCVPYLGVYLSDLTFIEDGNPDFIGDHKLINFRKRRLVASILQLLQSYQQISFPFSRDEKLSTMLKSALSQNYDTKKQWARSLEREPRESAVEDVKASQKGNVNRQNSKNV